MATSAGQLSNFSQQAAAVALSSGAAQRIPDQRRRGRGVGLNMAGRFAPTSREVFDDGWQTLDELPPYKTDVTAEAARKIITTNDSPDLPFEQSINPYRGCEHGCVYCYARPTHSYMGLSAGLDFESKLFAKPNAAKLLRKELASDKYVCKPLALALDSFVKDRCVCLHQEDKLSTEECHGPKAWWYDRVHHARKGQELDEL